MIFLDMYAETEISPWQQGNTAPYPPQSGIKTHNSELQGQEAAYAITE